MGYFDICMINWPDWKPTKALYKIDIKNFENLKNLGAIRQIQRQNLIQIVKWRRDSNLTL